MSERVQLYTTAADGACANVKEENAGPDIYLVDPTEGTCPPVSTVASAAKQEEAPVVHLTDLPELPAGSPCTIVGEPPNVLCQCSSFLGELPSPITPGQQCGPDGKSTFSFDCSTRLVKPWSYSATSTVGRQIVATSEPGDFEGCVCADPTLGWDTGYIIGEAHVMQPVCLFLLGSNLRTLQEICPLLLGLVLVQERSLPCPSLPSFLTLTKLTISGRGQVRRHRHYRHEATQLRRVFERPFQDDQLSSA